MESHSILPHFVGILFGDHQQIRFEDHQQIQMLARKLTLGSGISLKELKFSNCLNMWFKC